METLWFCLLSFLLIGYVLLDGYDLGVGLLHLGLARSESDRRQMLAAIAPFWDANEVWLIAAGGTAFFAFPKLYASSFSGFYLPLMIVLWLLMARGLSIELRNHVKGPIWSPIWDAGFCLSSGGLILFFGVALGNLIRGVPLDANTDFFLPLWTDFRLNGANTGVLDWFTLLVGVQALLVIGTHGAFWLNYKLSGPLQARARRLAKAGLVAAGLYTLVLTPVIFEVQPQSVRNMSTSPWGAALPVACLAGLVLAGLALRGGKELAAFGWYSLFVAALMGTAAFTMFPFVLPSNQTNNGLTVFNASAGGQGLQLGLWWWIPGMLLAVGYSIYTHTQFSAKVQPEASGKTGQA